MRLRVRASVRARHLVCKSLRQTVGPHPVALGGTVAVPNPERTALVARSANELGVDVLRHGQGVDGSQVPAW